MEALKKLSKDITGIEIKHQTRDYIIYNFNHKDWLFYPEASLIMPLDSKKPEDLLKDVKNSFILNSSRIDRWFKNYIPRVSAVNLNLTNACNLDCIYCYASGGDYQRLSNSMTHECFESFMLSLRGHFDKTKPFRFEFFGGEPLLNENLIERVLDWEDARDVSVYPERIINRVSTNLTCLTPKIEGLLKRGNFILSISIDGSEHTQNFQRPYVDGQPTYDDIINNLRRIREIAPELICVARITVFKSAETLFDELKELIDLDLFDYCSIYNATFKDKDNENEEPTLDIAMEANYLKMAASYKELLSKGRFKGCLELNRYVEHLINHTCVPAHCRAGLGYYALSPDSSIHPCHRLIGDDKYRLVDDSINNIDKLDPAWSLPCHKKIGCADCGLRFFCAGGCKQQNLINTGCLVSVTRQTCSFSELLFYSALAVYHQLDDGMKAKILANPSEELFTLCGQVVV